MSSNQQRTPPNRHLVAFFTFIALLSLVYYVDLLWVSQNVSPDPLVVTLVAVTVIVPIISYVALHGMFWLLNIIKR